MLRFERHPSSRLTLHLLFPSFHFSTSACPVKFIICLPNAFPWFSISMLAHIVEIDTSICGHHEIRSALKKSDAVIDFRLSHNSLSFWLGGCSLKLYVNEWSQNRNTHQTLAYMFEWDTNIKRVYMAQTSVCDDSICQAWIRCGNHRGATTGELQRDNHKESGVQPLAQKADRGVRAVCARHRVRWAYSWRYTEWEQRDCWLRVPEPGPWSDDPPWVHIVGRER